MENKTLLRVLNHLEVDKTNKSLKFWLILRDKVILKRITKREIWELVGYECKGFVNGEIERLDQA